jgi:hypothetical protein
MSRVRQIATSPDVRAHSTLARIDYEDTFLVSVRRAQDRTAEEWARAILGDAPIGVRGALVTGWLSLGLRLGPVRSDRFVVGWAVRQSTPDRVLLGAGSRIGMPAELLLERRDPGTLLFATFIAHENAGARALWAPVAAGHQVVVRQILERYTPALAPAPAARPRIEVTA